MRQELTCRRRSSLLGPKQRRPLVEGCPRPSHSPTSTSPFSVTRENSSPEKYNDAITHINPLPPPPYLLLLLAYYLLSLPLLIHISALSQTFIPLYTNLLFLLNCSNALLPLLFFSIYLSRGRRVRGLENKREGEKER